MLGFCTDQNLELRRNTCFRGFKSSLAVNSLKRLALSKMRTSIMLVSKCPFIFSRQNRKFYCCTQTAIGVFTQKCKILKIVPKWSFVFHSKTKKFRIAPRLPFVLWLQNTKFLKLFQNSHLLFDNKLKNLKLHPNCHSFFDQEIQNLKSYPKTKIEL